jgi:hypothetical protein
MITDSATLDDYALSKLSAVRPADVKLVTDEEICWLASEHYAHDTGPAESWEQLEAVVVVSAGEYRFVQEAKTAGHDAQYWEVAVYDKNWEWVVNYGEGH